MRHAAQILAILPLLIAVAQIPTARGSEITTAGHELEAQLDAMDVEHLWLPKTKVKDWRTGESTGEQVSLSNHTHCSAFVAAFCQRHDIPMLSPPPQLCHSKTGYCRVSSESHFKRKKLVFSRPGHPHNETLFFRVAQTNPVPITAHDRSLKPQA
jgi:hypothetical protein